MRKVFATIVLACIFSCAANAALLSTVTFAEQSISVAPDEIVEVWVTLTLDEASDPLFIDHLAGGPSFGLIADVVPSTGQIVFPSSDPNAPYVPFSDWGRVRGAEAWSPCGSNPFIAACGSGSYEYADFGYKLEETFLWHTEYNPYGGFENETFLLSPGESIDFLALAFQPIDGEAQPGTYELYNVRLELLFWGEDTEGNQYNGRTSLGDTCSPRLPECYFSATVVPIPASGWLFGPALLVLGRFRTIAKKRAPTNRVDLSPTYRA